MAFPADEDYEKGIGFSAGFCPACSELILIYQEGEYYVSSQGNITSIHNPTVVKLVYPLGKVTKTLSDEVPAMFRSDYDEAVLVLPISCKASAALSRRCLQNFLHNKLNIRKKNLAHEIDEFLATQQVPTVILDAVDAVRNIGNFAAHPLKNTNTGEIVDVEPGEAEWLLEVLDLLFDFYFIQPKKLEERKTALNAKLKGLGKPIMK
ncbi:DUF4145 domain-containing protein [Paenibacillus sp. MCAF9]|uniref:DUF4145 domain-containing protein n=1 Tax=Paenibacillus sp. MCAF9 TaxID=3233046 RepID=UPI003F9CF164